MTNMPYRSAKVSHILLWTCGSVIIWYALDYHLLKLSKVYYFLEDFVWLSRSLKTNNNLQQIKSFLLIGDHVFNSSGWLSASKLLKDLMSLKGVPRRTTEKIGLLRRKKKKNGEKSIVGKQYKIYVLCIYDSTEELLCYSWLN